MASFYSTKDSRGYQLRLDVTQGTQSIVNNTSVVSWSLYLVVGSWSFNNYTLSDSLTWADLESDGTKEWTWPTGSQFSCNGTNKTVLVSSGSKTIAHNADGSKSLTVSASFRTNSATTTYGPTAVLTLSGALALTTIPRASQPTLSASSAALGAAVIITTNRATADFTHVLTYAIGTQTGAIASGVGASHSWTLPNEIANGIPMAKSGRVVITCKTYNGATLVGTKAASIIATVPNSPTFQPVPTISSIAEAVAMPNGITVFVQGKSKMKVTSSGVSQYPANNVAEHKVTIAGSNYYGPSVTSATIMASGTVAVTLTVTDKRGYSRSVTQNVTVHAYSPPSISSFTARRSPDDQGTGLYSAYTYAVSAVSSQNSVSWTLRYRLAGATTWTNITSATTPYDASMARTDPGILNGNKSYEIGFLLTDKWSTATQTLNVGSVFDLTNYNASGRGIAFGKVSEKDAFEVGMPAEFNLRSRFPDGASFSTKDITGDYNLSPIEIREANFVTGTQSAIEYSPTISFHWGGRVAKQISLDSQGEFTIRNNSTIYGQLWHSGNSYTIIDSGSNTNGSYIRFSDGTQICYRGIGNITGLSIANGSYWTSGAYAFPAAFVGSPINHISCFVADSDDAPRNAVPIPHYASNWQWFISNTSGGTITQLLTVSLLAIGRWK